MSAKVQRIQITFGRDDSLKYLAHLDLMRTWERVLKRAAIPMAYSEGFSPRPRIAIGAPLPVGVTSECELMDLICAERIALDALQGAIAGQLPDGLRLLAAREIPMGWPSLQSLVRAAEYEVVVDDPRPPNAWQEAIDALLARDTIPWEHQRGEETRRYDLRPLLQEIAVIETRAGRATLRLVLRNDERGSGRPEQVTRALGAGEEPSRIHRRRLDVDEPALGRAAYRAAGRMAD